MNINEIVSRFESKSTGNGKWQAKCPSHSDGRASLTITEKDDKVLLFCHAGCETNDILNSVGLTPKDLFSGDGGFTKAPKTNGIEKIYPYKDSKDCIVHEKIRFRNKGFANRHIDKDGSIFWGMDKGLYYETYPGSNEYSKKKRDNAETKESKGITPLIYNLKNVLKAIKENKDIYLVEGEKDANRLNKMGFIATTNFEGAGKGKFKKAYSKYFKDGNVIVIQDSDKAGQEATETIVNILFDVVKTIKTVDLGDYSKAEGFDITDYFDMGYTEKEFKQLIDDTPIITQKNSASGKDTKEIGNEAIDINYITKEGFHKDPNNALGVYKSKQGYMLGKIDKKGERYVIPLTNFYIEVLEMINNDDENILRCNLHGNGTKTEKFIHEDDFINIHKFREATSDFNFINKLKDDNLQDLKFIENKTDYRKINGVSNIGFHHIDGKDVYITDTKALSKDLKIIDDVVILDEKIQVKSDLLEFEEITKEELEELAPFLFNFNSLEITASMLGTITTMMMKSKLFDEGIRAKHLVMYGEAGAGKSETRRNIINSYLGLDDKDTLNCNNITQFSLNKFLGSSDGFPVMLEEYKPWKMTAQTLSVVSDALRNSYDCVSAIRGTKNQGLIRYPLKAPMVLVGEEGQDEGATKERSMIVNFSKLESRSHNRRECFLNLCKRKDLLSKLGRSVLNVIIQTDTESILKDRQAIIDNGLARLQDDRVNDTVINAILGISMIGKVFKDLGVDFESSTNTKLKDIAEAINLNTFTEVLDNTHTTKTVVDNTIELINIMVERYLLIEGIHFTYINNDTELGLNVPLLFDEVTKYKKDYNVSIEILTTRKQFTSQLSKTSYYLDYKSAKYNNPITKKTKSTKSFILSIAELKERQLEVETLCKNTK